MNYSFDLTTTQTLTMVIVLLLLSSTRLVTATILSTQNLPPDSTESFRVQQVTVRHCKAAIPYIHKIFPHIQSVICSHASPYGRNMC